MRILSSLSVSSEKVRITGPLKVRVYQHSTSHRSTCKVRLGQVSNCHWVKYEAVAINITFVRWYSSRDKIKKSPWMESCLLSLCSKLPPRQLERECPHASGFREEHQRKISKTTLDDSAFASSRRNHFQEDLGWRRPRYP